MKSSTRSREGARARETKGRRKREEELIALLTTARKLVGTARPRCWKSVALQLNITMNGIFH